MNRRLQPLAMLAAVVITAIVLSFATPTSSQEHEPGQGCPSNQTEKCVTRCTMGVDAKMRCVMTCTCERDKSKE